MQTVYNRHTSIFPNVGKRKSAQTPAAKSAGRNKRKPPNELLMAASLALAGMRAICCANMQSGWDKYFGRLVD